MARDCQANKRDPNLPPGASPPPSALNGVNNSMIKGGGFDSEYERLMAELGESGKDSGPIGGGHDITGGGLNVPPWRRPDVWAPPVAPPAQQNQGFRPPQQGTFGSSMWAQAGFQQFGGYDQQQQQPDYYAQYYQQYQQYPQGYAQQA